ncbi:MinD/ParA family ATP-binding protein [Mycobacterium stomatepiae]|uniref:ESX-1 secretion-associated protein EspI n=1 Tax=Mycobacterium stomatepiae TaxID=470076 RepID=A0A7I7QC10_9MYCO|nr:MinD/ParA family protein [Mycobacterium stomatepiae]MCV7166924.1 MinD/ParA family protein [Mycobacterium stomatepiae]BBY23809.1 ESX-1 secretion-associated protein EspI [Mycobacterium stomatepiae]
MGADYDRLFQPPPGGEIPDTAADSDFDVDAGFDVDSPAAAMPAGPETHHPPMPVDQNEQPPPAPPEIHCPPMPVDETRPAPSRPGPPRPPMPVSYDELFAPPEGVEIPDPGPDFDLNSGFDTRVAPVSAGTPVPNGHAPPPRMPVDWDDQSPPARPEPAAARPEPPRPPMPVDWNNPPPRPKPPPIEPGPPAAPPPPPRRARQAPRDPAGTPRPPTANPSHRPAPDAAKHRGKPGPPRPRPPGPAAHAQRGAAQRGSAPTPPPGNPPPTADATSHIGVRPAKKSATRMVARRGWRRWIHKLTRINVGLSRDEKYDLDLRSRIRRSPRGSYQIAVLGLKGGVGKTTVTVALGSVYAQVRRDRILAFDADASCGNLADRAGRQSGATIADLLADKDLTHYNDVRAHTSANAVNLEILPAEDYSTARRAFSEADWHYASDAVSKFYNLVLADCGAGLFDPVTRGVLSTASAAVIVTSASIDAARQAAVAIDWLRNHGHQDLLNRACVVINHVSPGDTNIAVAELSRQFEQYVRRGRVVVLPWDKHIAAGDEIQLSLLDPTYKRKILELAAALSDDFDRSERR